MDERGGANPASGQNADSQREHRRLRLPGLDVSRGQQMASEEKPPEVAGETATADAAHQWLEPGGHRGQGQSHPARLAGLLQGRPPQRTQWPGRLAPPTTASDAAQAAETARLRVK